MFSPILRVDQDWLIQRANPKLLVCVQRLTMMMSILPPALCSESQLVADNYPTGKPGGGGASVSPMFTARIRAENNAFLSPTANLRQARDSDTNFIHR